MSDINITDTPISNYDLDNTDLQYQHTKIFG